MILFYLSLTAGILAFKPVWIGSEFRATSFVTPEENDKLQAICGRANVSDHPWAVAILLHGSNRIGGAIISPYHVLTVAHGFMKLSTGSDGECMASQYRRIEELQKKRLVVYGGKCIRGETDYLPNHPNCSKPDVQVNRIRSVLIDGLFTAGSCLDGHDFAIIELEHKIIFNNKTAPICLPTTTWPTLQNVLTVSGWGRSNKVFHESGPLIHEASMLIDKYCRRPWSDKLPRDAIDILCATSLNRSDYNAPRICHVMNPESIRGGSVKGPDGVTQSFVNRVGAVPESEESKRRFKNNKRVRFQGDSGSGMEQRDEQGRATLIGLTSFGTQGCPANLLARFTRVGYFLREICTHTGVCTSASR